MARRSARAAEGSVPGGHVDPATSHSLVNAPLVEEDINALIAALEGRVRQTEEHQTEMLTLLRNRRASQAPNPGPEQGNPPPPALDHAPTEHFARERNVPQEEFPNAASTVRPISPAREPEAHQQHHRPEAAGFRHAIGGLTREEIRNVIAEECRQVDRRATLARRPLHHYSPLAPGVLTYPIPHGFKLPNIETFDGTDDPLEHINHFITIMRIYNAPDQLLCQVFPVTLRGQARTWFHSLREGAIDSFAELARQFTDQFIASRRIIRDPSHLSGIRQNEGETLKDFFRRFTNEARQIPGVDPELLRGVFLGGLRPGGFYSALMRETVPSYLDLVHRVETQIAADEAIEAHRQQFEGSSKRQRGQESSPPLVPKKNDARHDNPRRDQGPRQYQDYTPLNTSRTNVLLAISNDDIIKRPRPLPTNTGNQSQYCDFHRGRGHKTEDCTRLKEEIERLVRQGLLGNFLETPAL